MGTAVTALTATVVTGGALFHLAFLAGAAGVYASDRLARRWVRDRLHKLAKGQVELVRLGNEADGELVHLCGRVRATRTLPGILYGTPAVYRRLTLSIGGTKFVHHSAVEFDLVDERNEPVIVDVADNARLLAPDLESADYPIAHFLRQALPPSLARVFESRRSRLGSTSSACELLLREGDAVEVLGYKSRAVDPRVLMRLERETPMRPSLRSGAHLPLLITAVGRQPTREI